MNIIKVNRATMSPRKGEVFCVRYGGKEEPFYFLCAESCRAVNLETGDLTTLALTWNHSDVSGRAIFAHAELHLERTSE